MNKAGILIIEDDKAIKNLIATTLDCLLYTSYNLGIL